MDLEVLMKANNKNKAFNYKELMKRNGQGCRVVMMKRSRTRAVETEKQQEGELRR